ncbi:hypothetical protein PV11_08667 [Exophiala sideris]|uniref:FAD/NAD(P)-binding domain-containing protein n=1 Tax=Exophiala sideris TaxID=1016849 RepID=A0A0D1VXZ9_9EURO|nr:hypothetical protein PV11_08667 [Exophiala sideris]
MIPVVASLLAFFSALSSISAAPLPAQNQTILNFDVIVVGGGPSGLSALSGLARVRRNALLIDSGEYRNQWTRHAHDVIGSDGVTPAYFRANARQQIAEYPTITMQNGTVTSIEQLNSTAFLVRDSSGVQYISRKVILGTGLQDILPSTPGISENWARGIYWCPWCDGYEHRDQPLGLLGSIEKIQGLVEEVRTLNTDLIAFVNGTMTADRVSALDASSPGWENLLTTYGVTIENGTIEDIERIQDGAVYNSQIDKAEYDKFLVHLDNGTTIERAAFFTSFPSTQRSTLGQSLGVVLVEGKLSANMTGGMRTNVDGVYAIGDANSDGSTNIPHAMWSGKRSAVDIHLQLAEEDAVSATAIAGITKRGLEDEETALLRFMEAV